MLGWHACAWGGVIYHQRQVNLLDLALQMWSLTLSGPSVGARVGSWSDWVVGAWSGSARGGSGQGRCIRDGHALVEVPGVGVPGVGMP